MSDFHQNGTIATFHNLRQRSLEDLEAELVRISRHTKIALVLPSLYSELEGPALSGIVDELAKVEYLDRIVIGLDRADRAQFDHACEFFSRLPQKHAILWNDGPRLQEIDRALAKLGLAPKELGKGRNVWYCFGYLLASGGADATALHDCDITTYSREMLARLVYPVATPDFDYVLSKGYYPRIAGAGMTGRVCRLFVTPLLEALRKVLGPLDYLEYLSGFRYPLSGEMALSGDVIGNIRIPSDWGLEIGVLSEAWRNYASKRIAQCEIADVYDHKHQPLSIENANAGLSKMSVDIARSLFRKLATEGQVFSVETYRTLKAAYYRLALDYLDVYSQDARMNGLTFDRDAEERAVEGFANNIMRAGMLFLENPMEAPFMPAWNRIVSAAPQTLDMFVEAVEDDNRRPGA